MEKSVKYALVNVYWVHWLLLIGLVVTAFFGQFGAIKRLRIARNKKVSALGCYLSSAFYQIISLWLTLTGGSCFSIFHLKFWPKGKKFENSGEVKTVWWHEYWSFIGSWLSSWNFLLWAMNWKVFCSAIPTRLFIISISYTLSSLLSLLCKTLFRIIGIFNKLMTCILCLLCSFITFVILELASTHSTYLMFYRLENQSILASSNIKILRLFSWHWDLKLKCLWYFIPLFLKIFFKCR